MKLSSKLALALVALLAFAVAPAFADDKVVTAAGDHAVADNGRSGAGIGAGVGAGLAIVGAGLGIGLIGYAALSGIARQPEAAGKIQVNMIVMAALVEGATIIALLLINYGLVGKIVSP